MDVDLVLQQVHTGMFVFFFQIRCFDYGEFVFFILLKVCVCVGGGGGGLISFFKLSMQWFVAIEVPFVPM